MVSPANRRTIIQQKIIGSDEFIPRSNNENYFIFLIIEFPPLEAEMITVRGTITGKLRINTICMSFKNEEISNPSNDKYIYGSCQSMKISKQMHKKWQLNSIKEIVIKRFNLLRQAVEIYFFNSKSAFFLLYNESNVSQFLEMFSKNEKIFCLKI